MKKNLKKEYKTPNTFFDPSEQEKKKPDLAIDAFRVSAQRRNEVRQRGPTTAPILRSTFMEQGPVGNSMVNATPNVFEQLHRGRNSEHVHARMHACTKHRGVNQLT